SKRSGRRRPSLRRAALLLLAVPAFPQAPLPLSPHARLFLATAWTRVDRIEDFPRALQVAAKRPELGRLILGGRAKGLRFLYLESDGPLQRAELLLFSVNARGQAAQIEDWWAPDQAASIDQLKRFAREGGLAPVDRAAH